MDSRKAGRAVPTTLGERLRAARAKAHVTQSHLTQISGVPKTMLSRYENDHVLPSVTSLLNLADALGESVSALVGNGPSALHSFIAVLGERGMAVVSEVDAQKLANVIADLVEEGDDRLRFLLAPSPTGLTPVVP